MLVGFFSSRFIPSGSELLLNYPETFELYSLNDASGRLNWLGDHVKVGEEFLVKREYTFDIPPILKKVDAVQRLLPLNMHSKFTEEHEKLMSINQKTMQAIMNSGDSSKLIKKDQQSIDSANSELESNKPTKK